MPYESVPPLAIIVAAVGAMGGVQALGNWMLYGKPKVRRRHPSPPPPPPPAPPARLPSPAHGVGAPALKPSTPRSWERGEVGGREGG